LVDSLSRPSGNVTGVNNYLSDLGAKRLELLRELVPNAAVIGVLVNPSFPDAESQSKDVKEAARKLGQQVQVVNANSENDFDRAFATFVQLQARVLLVTVDPLFNSRREQLIALAARHKIPAMYFGREFVLAGGLMSYASWSLVFAVPCLDSGHRDLGRCGLPDAHRLRIILFDDAEGGGAEGSTGGTCLSMRQYGQPGRTVVDSQRVGKQTALTGLSSSLACAIALKQVAIFGIGTTSGDPDRNQVSTSIAPIHWLPRQWHKGASLARGAASSSARRCTPPSRPSTQ
jgi:hypothetical protein